MKRCSRCGETKPVADFYRWSRAKDGLQFWCKSCKRAANQAWYRANPAYDANYRRRHHAKRVAYDKAYFRSLGPEARATRFRALHRWREENPERWAAYRRRWREENRKKVNRQGVLDVSRRRARKRETGGRCSQTQIEARIAYYGWQCWLCRAPWEEIDHVKPLSKGGSHWPANLRPICRSCNGHKHNRWPLVAP